MVGHVAIHTLWWRPFLQRVGHTRACPRNLGYSWHKNTNLGYSWRKNTRELVQFERASKVRGGLYHPQVETTWYPTYYTLRDGERADTKHRRGTRAIRASRVKHAQQSSHDTTLWSCDCDAERMQSSRRGESTHHSSRTSSRIPAASKSTRLGTILPIFRRFCTMFIFCSALPST